MPRHGAGQHGTQEMQTPVTHMGCADILADLNGGTARIGHDSVHSNLINIVLFLFHMENWTNLIMASSSLVIE